VSRRILLVDDEPGIVDFVSYGLAREGFEVVSVGDGQEALDRARAEPFDLMVLDVMLPRLSGTDVARALRRESDLPIVMLTARDAETDLVVGLESGADDYVTKPFSMVELVSRIRALLPVETMTVFVESRNAVSVKAIFKRKFGKTLQLRKFKATFEFNHQWITTSTSFAWSARNWLLRVWFEAKKRMGRGLRKKIRYWFKS